MKNLILFFLFHTAAFGQLTFQNAEIEARPTPDEELITVDFAFSNQTENAVQIRGIHPQCTCLTVAATALSIPAGGKGVLQATLHAENFFGNLSKSAEISYVGHETPQIITIKAHIPEILKPDIRTLQWSFEEPRQVKTIRITVDEKYPTAILSATPSNQAFTVTLRTIEEKKCYEISVTPPQEQNSSAVLGILKLQTDSSFQRHKSIECYLLIRPKGR